MRCIMCAVSRRLPADERRAQLLAAAIALSEEHGLGALTIRGVAERAGVSLGVVHYCFVDKDELVNGVIQAVNDDIANATRAFLSLDFTSGDTGADALREHLREAINLVWAVVEATPNRRLLTYEIATYALRHPNPEMVKLAVDQYSGYDELADLVLKRCGEASQMYWADHAGMARFVAGIIDEVSLRWLIDRDLDGVHQILGHGVDLVVSKALSSAGESPAKNLDT